MSKTFAQVAYEGYCRSSDGKSLVSGATLPAWEKLSDEIKAAWAMAAEAVGAEMTEPKETLQEPQDPESKE